MNKPLKAWIRDAGEKRGEEREKEESIPGGDSILFEIYQQGNISSRIEGEREA